MEDQDYLKLANSIIKKFKDLGSLKPDLTFDEEGKYIISILKALHKKGYETGHNNGWMDGRSELNKYHI